MSEQVPDTESRLQEQLIDSKQVGYIAAGNLPWLEHLDPNTQVNVSEMTFQDGVIYVASAIPESLQKIAAVARSQDPRLDDGEYYSRSDVLLITAAHLEANGQADSSTRTGYLRGNIDPKFNNFTIKAYKESPKPNTRRLYYGLQRLDTVPLVRTQEGNEQPSSESLFLVRLALTDKKNQLQTLQKLTTENQRALRVHGAGSI